MQRDVAQLQSQAVKLSLNKMQHLMNGRDTLITDFADSELKLVIYSDSSACSSCVVQKMYLWNRFIESTSKYQGRLKYYFIFSPVKEEEVVAVDLGLRIDAFNYPVFIDGSGVFAKENPHLPQNSKLHSFLLDKDNQVIFVGNPLRSEKLEEMFYVVLEDKLGKNGD